MEDFKHSVDTTEDIEHSITNSLIDNNSANKIVKNCKYYILCGIILCIFVILIIICVKIIYC